MTCLFHSILARYLDPPFFIKMLFLVVDFMVKIHTSILYLKYDCGSKKFTAC